MVQNGIVITDNNLEKRELKYKSLQIDKYHLLALRETPLIVSVREMKYIRGVQDVFSSTYPIIDKMLNTNLFLANLFLHRFIGGHTHYIYFGLNFLRNRNFVLDQYLNRDYYDPRRDHKT